jgi:sec-independent protein translocase protein TatC
MADDETQEHEQLPDEKRMSLVEHLEELRRRLIYSLAGLAVAMALALIFGHQIIALLKYPYDKAVSQLGMPSQLSVLSAGAGFDAYMKVSFYCGLILSCPWIVYQLWMFVSAGLYPRERRYVTYSVPFSALLFMGGAAFFLLAVSVPAIRFLLWFDHWMGLNPIVTLQSHVEFMTDMILAFGLAFQTPLAIFILARVGLVSIRTLNRYRRHAIFVILVFSAVFAPPDVLSMLAMALPMWMLFEAGVLLAYITVRKQERQEREEDARDRALAVENQAPAQEGAEQTSPYDQPQEDAAVAQQDGQEEKAATQGDPEPQDHEPAVQAAPGAPRADSPEQGHEEQDQTARD